MKAELFLLIISVSLVGLSVLVYENLISPELALISDLRSELSGSASAISQYQSVENEVKLLLSKYRSAPQLAQAINISLPDLYGSAPALEDLKSAAVSVGAKVKSAEAESVSGNGAMGYWKITLELEAGYAAVKDFINSIEKSSKVMNVISVDFHHPEQAKAVIATYFQK
ncbi:MAG: hypothetical protein AAB885_00060 [Patescibacteria group bacterium]